MDHKAFLSGLPASTRNALTERSDAPALIHLAIYWGLILIFGLYIHKGLPFWPLLLIPMVIPMTWFRYFHLAHHRFTNDPENDPELNTAKPETAGQYLWHISGIPIWRGNIGKLFKNATRDNHDPYAPK